MRSFAHAVRAVLPPLDSTHLTAENIGWQPELFGGERYHSTWRLKIPEQLRTREVGATLQEISRSRSLIPVDPVGARRILDEARSGESPVQNIVFGLTRAEIAGLLDDAIGVVTLNWGSDARRNL